MIKRQKVKYRLLLLLAAMIALVTASPLTRADTGSCSGQALSLPFTDVQGNIFFCQIAEAYANSSDIVRF